jgi:hypothetical protein
MDTALLVARQNVLHLSIAGTFELPEQPILVLKWTRVNGRLEGRWVLEIR